MSIMLPGRTLDGSIEAERISGDGDEFKKDVVPNLLFIFFEYK